MRPDEFEGRMRALEVFHALRLPPGAWAILRLDGRGFSRLTEAQFDKPFDERFHAGMVQTARVVLDELQGRYAYTESDEISVRLPRDWSLFDREVEKAVSLSAGLASAAFSLACGERAHFDSRAVVAARDDQVVDYFRWRQADACRCALNGWCYWTLRKTGQGVTESTAALKGKDVAYKNELLFRSGVNFNDLPLWQRRGTGLYWERFEREGYDPKRNQPVTVTRRRLKVDRGLPMGEEYDTLIRRVLAGSVAANTETDGRTEPWREQLDSHGQH